jgi:hypothetical protein
MPYFDDRKVEIHHTCGNCPTGSAIPQNNRKDGQPPGSRLCASCSNLQLSGQCTNAAATGA